MKKFISAFLAVILLMASMSMLVFAEGEQGDADGELTNIATNGVGYCTTMKNSNWTPPNSINDGVYDWHGWEPKYPIIEPGQDTSKGFSGEYCGIKFVNREYYEIYEIKMTVGLHALYGQNATYKIQALVEGEWQDVVTLKDEQFVPRDADTNDLDGDGDTTEKKYSSYADAMERDKTNYHIGAELTYTLPTPITTNNIRITVSDFAKNFPGGDVLIFPYIYEVELIGKLGVTPDIDLPEGAEFSQNSAYNALPYATSSARLYYSFLAIDGKDTTCWKPSSLEAGQALTLELEKEYNIEKFIVNFGKLPAGQTPNTDFKLEALIDGAWQSVALGADGVASVDPESLVYTIEYMLASPVKASQVRLIYEQALTVAPAIYELEAHITGDRTYYLSSRFSQLQKLSSAKGNLAILGEAYASANIVPYSEPSYINDGLNFGDSPVWFSGLIDIPVSCGVKLDKAYTINKVVVYCEEPDLIGDDVTSFNIIASLNGVNTVIASGKSYDATKIVERSETRYTTVYEFPEGVLADDIKIEFTRGDSTIPNVKELEIYSDSVVNSAFTGFPLSKTDVVPTYTDVIPEPEPTLVPEPPVDNENDPTVPIIIGVSLCFVAAGIAVASIFIVKKNKGKQTSNETANSEENKDEK